MENIIAFRSFFVNGHYTHIYSAPKKHFLHGLPRTEQDFLTVGHRRRPGILLRRNAGASGRYPAAYVFSAGCGAVPRRNAAVRISDFSLPRNDFCRPVPCTAPARDAGYSLILRAVRLRTESVFLCKNAQVNRNAFPFLDKQGHFFFPQASHCFHVRRGVRRADYIHFFA